MYIEFHVPEQFSDRVVVAQLHLWSDQYQVPYNTKQVKGYRRVTFDHDHLYDFFVITWNPPEQTRQVIPALNTWRIVIDPNNKTTFESTL